MPQIRWFAWAGLAFLYALFIAIAIPAALGDDLFYRSDIYSLSVVIAVAGLILFPIVALAAWGLSCLPNKLAITASRLAAYVAAIGIIDIFLALTLLYLVGLLNWVWLTKLIKHPIIALVVCVLPAAAIIYLQNDKEGVLKRVMHVGCFALVASPFLLAYAITSSRNQAEAIERHPANGPNLVLIVLDGWPTQHLHAYNPDAPASEFDQLLDNALIYLGARTSAAWTSGFFGTLYNGNPRVAAGEKRKRPPTKSLGARLQEKGVGTRFINFHRNGIPEGSNAHRTDHKGLRSYFLTEKYTWIPRWFGLEYHISLSGPAMAQNLSLGYANRLFKLANPTAADDRPNVFTDILIPELRQLREKHKATFTLFHTGWSNLGKNPDIEQQRLPGAQKMEKENHGDFPTEEVRANDYRYDPELEPLVRSRRQTTQNLMLRQGVYLSDFLSELYSDPVLADTVVVFTADHGSIYGKGRVWYGFHPNQEVVRVPFIVFNGARTGIEPALLATPALTSAIDDLFVTSRTPSGFKLEASSKRPALSLTLKSNVHKEWMLVASYPGKAYWMNLHPDGPGETLQMNIEGYRETLVKRFSGMPPELAARGQAILNSFGIAPSEIHPSFR